MNEFQRFNPAEKKSSNTPSGEFRAVEPQHPDVSDQRRQNSEQPIVSLEGGQNSISPTQISEMKTEIIPAADGADKKQVLEVNEMTEFSLPHQNGMYKLVCMPDESIYLAEEGVHHKQIVDASGSDQAPYDAARIIKRGEIFYLLGFSSELQTDSGVDFAQLPEEERDARHAKVAELLSKKFPNQKFAVA